MKPNALLLGMLLGCLCLTAPAAETAPAAAPADLARPALPASSKPPYSSLEETETEQVLRDGNVISRKFSSPSYRDSAGNTRREYRSALSNFTRVYITLVGGTRYVLDPEAKTATKSLTLSPAATATPAAPGKATSGASETGKPATPNGAQEIRVRVVDTPSPQLAKSAIDVFADTKPKRVYTRTPLGSRNINGEMCTGTLMSYVIEAGEQGNLNPITVSHETWIADALRIMMFSKTTDPRSGNTTARVIELTRAEPDPALFAVPPDYTIVEDPPAAAP